MRLNRDISHDTLLSELVDKPLGPMLKRVADQWMRKHSSDRSEFDRVYGTAFDLAVDCAYALEMVPCPVYSALNGEDTYEVWDIPIYLTELAEEIVGIDA